MRPHFEIEDDDFGPRRRAMQVRIRTLLWAVAVTAVWFVILGLPGVGDVVGKSILLVALGLGVGVGAMALGALGFLLVHMAERYIRGRGARAKPRGLDEW